MTGQNFKFYPDPDPKELETYQDLAITFPQSADNPAECE